VGADAVFVAQEPDSERPDGTVHFISLEQAALMLGCGRSTLYRLYIHTGDLHLIHHGRRSVVAVAEVNRLAAKLASKAGVILSEDLSAG